MHGLTFIAAAYTPECCRRWKEDERLRNERMDRFRRTILPADEHLSDQQRELLRSIDRQVNDPTPVESKIICPECRRFMAVVKIREMEVDCCRFCRSIWFDPGELQTLSGQEKEIPSDHLAHRPSKYECPVCRAEMTEYVFVNPHNLLVDRCPNGHGVYLEDRELERVFDLV